MNLYFLFFLPFLTKRKLIKNLFLIFIKSCYTARRLRFFSFQIFILRDKIIYNPNFTHKASAYRLIIGAQGHLARKSFARKIFKLDSWSPGVGFSSIGTINLSLERRRDYVFKTIWLLWKERIKHIWKFSLEHIPMHSLGLWIWLFIKTFDQNPSC